MDLKLTAEGMQAGASLVGLDKLIDLGGLQEVVGADQLSLDLARFWHLCVWLGILWDSRERVDGPFKWLTEV